MPDAKHSIYGVINAMYHYNIWPTTTNRHDVVLLKDNQGWKYNVAARYVKRQLIDYKR